MNELKTRVAYLHGLSAGLDISAESKEGKLLQGIIEILDEFADSVDSLEEAQEQMEEYLDSIDEDLLHLEDEIYESDDMCACGDEFIEVDCKGCGETVCFDAAIVDDDDIIEVTCPNCDKVVYINNDTHQTADEQEILIGKVSADAKHTDEDI
ncbi:MAG: AraC family transcriptional regulator [Desulfotomaculaceae bacterium]|nr:AraC family transcriptional regulator [Desulfotomaculaceae bacterium]